MNTFKNYATQKLLLVLSPIYLFCLSFIFLYSCQSKTSSASEDAISLNIDGSSTVYPISEDIVEKYKRQFNNYNIQLAVSGTGGGFQKFCNGEIQINNASREITQEEITKCEANSIAYIEYEVAFDGIAIVVSKDNDWVDHLTVEELKLIFSKNGVQKWSDLRDGWPEQTIKPYGPGEASGTYDFFKEVILNQEDFREDFISSENDNLLALGIEKNQTAIGFFGHSYFESNKDKLSLIPIDNGDGPVLSTIENIGNGSYTPLSRPLYIYVNKDFIDHQGGSDFIRFYLEEAGPAALGSGYVALSRNRYKAMIASLQTRN